MRAGAVITRRRRPLSARHGPDYRHVYDLDDERLRRGWTTGTCATAAAKAAYAALLTGEFPDPVTVTLPRGERAAFALAIGKLEPGSATAGIIKDAGDDPDVTHGALITATVRQAPLGSGVTFLAGPVGMVTRPGLAVPPGEPAINPVPRQMIASAIAEVAAGARASGDVCVTIGVADGERLAAATLNGRLGIVGGLSILGTTGIVVPYSCSAWIASIHRGIDVARAAGIDHVAASTGASSEAAVTKLYGLPEIALIDMGDFVGGMLKYLRRHPVARVTIAGGVAKMTKLAQGLLDLHSKRGAVDLAQLAQRAVAAGGSEALAARIAQANTAAEAFGCAAAEELALGDAIAAAARATACAVVEGCGIAVEVLAFNREGQLVGHAPFAVPHDTSPPRNRRR